MIKEPARHKRERALHNLNRAYAKGACTEKELEEAAKEIEDRYNWNLGQEFNDQFFFSDYFRK